MNIALAFTRVFFLILSIFFMTTYMFSFSTESTLVNVLLGVGLGFVLGFLLIAFDFLFRRYNLRSFNIVIIGLFLGFLMGKALLLIFNVVLDISASSTFSAQVIEIIKISLFLFGTYLGTIMTLRCADEIYVSFPFVKFTPMAQKKKDLLIDATTLADSRIIDLAASGLIDHHLMVPRFIIKELYAQAESSDETLKNKALRSLEALKKLEELPELEIRYNDTDFPEIKDSSGKLIRLARLLDANILSAEMSRVQMADIEGIRIINIHSLSHALTPLMKAGETIKIKIQRYGKEPRQGVGYLDDGTMVVVNGGGDFIDQTIEASVLSVKRTASGRMIFCNVLDDEHNYDDKGYDSHDTEY